MSRMMRSCQLTDFRMLLMSVQEEQVPRSFAPHTQAYLDFFITSITILVRRPRGGALD